MTRLSRRRRHNFRKKCSPRCRKFPLDTNAPDKWVRRDFLRRVIALDPVIDEAFGESSQLRYHSPVLQTAVDGLFAALASWRAVSVHLTSLSTDRARQEADAVLQTTPEELRSAPERGEPSRWIADPTGLR